jgi:hypothetical protein
MSKKSKNNDKPVVLKETDTQPVLISTEEELIVEPTSDVKPTDIEVNVKEDEVTHLEDDVITPQDEVPQVVAMIPEVKDSLQIGILRNRMDTYVEVMAVNRATELSTIITQQRTFISAIDHLLRLRGTEFSDGMKLMINIIKEHRKTVFGELAIFRGFEKIQLSVSQRNLYVSLINLLTTTADINDRKTIHKQINMEQLFANMKDGDAVQLLEEFYS